MCNNVRIICFVVVVVLLLMLKKSALQKRSIVLSSNIYTFMNMHINKFQRFISSNGSARKNNQKKG